MLHSSRGVKIKYNPWKSQENTELKVKVKLVCEWNGAVYQDALRSTGIGKRVLTSKGARLLLEFQGYMLFCMLSVKLPSSSRVTIRRHRAEWRWRYRLQWTRLWHVVASRSQSCYPHSPPKAQPPHAQVTVLRAHGVCLCLSALSNVNQTPLRYDNPSYIRKYSCQMERWDMDVWAEIQLSSVGEVAPGQCWWHSQSRLNAGTCPGSSNAVWHYLRPCCVIIRMYHDVTYPTKFKLIEF